MNQTVVFLFNSYMDPTVDMQELILYFSSTPQKITLHGFINLFYNSGRFCATGSRNRI